MTDTVSRKFERASEDDAKNGWLLDYRSLQEIQDTAMESENVSMEIVEAVTLALAKWGYVRVE